MALKDCKFFVDIDGRQVEMDFDGFRAHLMQDGMMATLAPAVTKKRGKSAGFTITAKKAEAPPARAEAPSATPAKQGKKKAAEKGYFKVTNGALRQIFNISKDQATGVIQIAKAMGIDLDEIRLARGEAVPPEEQGLEQKAVALTMDAEYLAAVKAKDLAKAQEMVIAAAQAAGYNETGSHGLAEGKLEGSKFDTARLGKHTRAASAKLGFFFGSKETAKAYAYKELNFDKAEEVSSMATAILTPLLDVIPKGKSSELDFARNNIETMFSPRVYPVVLPDNYVSDIYSEVARLMDEALFVADSDELTPSEEQILRNALRKAQELLNDTLGNVPFYSVIDAAQIDAVLQMSNPFVYDQEGKRYREQAYFDIIRQAKEQGHDSVIIKNTYDGGPLDDIKVVFNANQIKSADPVTYDDKGNVIPLSERFQSATPDIRYQKTIKTSDKKFIEEFRKTRLISSELAKRMLTGQAPEYLKEVSEFILRQRQKFLEGRMTARDIAKAYIITLSSIKAPAMIASNFEAKTGFKLPEYSKGIIKNKLRIRPEDAVSAWLLTSEGKQALDSLEQTGQIDKALWEPLLKLRDAFGSNTLRYWGFNPESSGINLLRLQEMTNAINQTKGDAKKLDAVVKGLQGIAEAKTGFIKHLLGFGETPTIDAREINYWITGQADIRRLETKQAELANRAKNARGLAYQQVVKRISDKIKGLAKSYGFDPAVGAHVMHHWIWDATEREATTHAVMMDAMELAQTGYHATRGLFAAESGFPNGRLRLDKVGSGMGGQAYGWGIYLAPERAGAASYYDALKAESPTAVLYELDVPDDVVAKLLDFDKPIPLKQRTAINRELKALGVDLEIDGVVSLGEVIEQIQDTAFPDNDDYAKLTSKLLDRAGIPGLQVSAFAEQRPYVLWNQEALDRVALLKANGEALRKISETSSSVTSTATTETEDGAGYWDVQPEEATQGLITFMDREDKRMTNGVLAVIRGFAAANVSTPIHEMFHFYRRFLLNEENGFTAAEIKAFEDWAGAKDGVWSTAADEKAARGFEKYLRTGVAPLESLNALFKRVAEWMRSVYKTLQNSPIDIDISSEARRVYDRIFTLAAERRAKPDTKVSKVKRGSKTLYQTQVSPEEGPIYLDNILEALKTWAPKGTPEQLKSHLSKFRGAIAEANWIGLPVFLEGRQRVSRADVEQYVKDNEITIEEVLLGEPLGARTHHARFAQYTLPYGREYRELLLTIKPQDPRLISTQAGTHVFLPGKQERTKAMDPVQAERELARLMRVPTPNFVKRAHYLTPNIVVHVRFNERTLSNGKKALFLEEIQSDWAQAQRQGQSGRAVTPFEDTPVWTALAFRRMLRWATDKGFDEIAWTGGMTQARRWSQIVNTQREPRTDIESIAFKLAGTQNEIRVRPYGMQELDMVVYPVDGKPETYKSITLETLESEFGRDVKRKIESQIAADLQSAQAGTFSQALVKEVSFSDAERRQPSVHYTNQPQLSQIARAMLTYYDTIIPKEVQKLIKPFGGKVTSARLESGQTVHAVSITDKMKAQARQGQVLFQREGEGATEETATEAYRKRLAAQRAKDVQAAFARLRQQTSTAEPRTAKTQTKTPESKKTTAASSSQPRQPRERREPGTEPKRGFGDKTLDQVFNELVEAVKAGTLPRQTAPATDTERLEERLRRNLRDIVVAAYSLKAIPESVAAQGRDFAAAMLKAQAAGDTATFEAAEQEFRKIAAAARRAMRPQPPPKPAKSVAEKFDDLLKGRVKSKPAAEFNLEQMADDNIARLARRFQAKLKIAIKQGADSEMYLENVTINGKTRSRRDLFVTGAEEYKQGLLENNPLLRQQGEDKMRAAIDTITSVLIDKKRPEWHNLRSPLSYANVIGSYEAIMGPLGKQISDEFKIVHSAIARGKTSFSDALRVLQSIIKEQYEPQMIAQGYLGMPGIIKEHIAFIQKTARFSAAVTEAKAQGTLFTNPAAWYAARRDLAQDFGYLPVAALILKSTVYNLKLRFNVKSAASNFSQLALSAGPYLTVDEFAKIVKDSLKPSTWRREVAPGMTLRDVAVGETGGRRVDGAPELSDKTRWWHRVDAFQISSDHVRVAAYLVGELMANRLEAQRSAEGKPLLSFGAKSMIIRDWVEKVEFDNSPWNRAPLFRGAKADILLQFKPFLQKNVERMMADLQRNPEGFIVRPARTAVGKLVDVTLPQNVRRVVKLLATQVTFGGIGSLLTVAPGLKAISGVLILAGLMNLFKNAFGMDDDEAEELAIGMYYGAPAAIGVDLSATVGFFDEPFGKDIYEQIVSYFLGPSVGSAANVVKRTREYFKASQEAPKLGREAEKAREVRERLLKIPAAVSPYIRMYQAAQDMVTGQPTIMRLQEEKPLSATQQIIQALGGNPIEQTMFFDTKEAFGWQNRLIGKPTGYERVKPKPGESDEAYFKRAAVAETLASQYLPALQRHPQFQQMSSSDQAALLDNLSRNITEEAGKTRPDRRKLQANTLIRNRKQTIREQRKRARREARTAGFIR